MPDSSTILEAYTAFRRLFKGIDPRTAPFTAGNWQDALNKYKDVLGLGNNVTFSDSAFNDYASSRTIDFHFLKEGSPDLHEKLGVVNTDATGTAAQLVRDGITEALKPDEQFTNAQQKYSDSAAAFAELVKEVPAKYDAEAVISTMTELKDDGIKAIKEQQEREINALEAQFENPAFKNALETSLALTSETDFANAKSRILDNLNKAHKQTLDAFEESTTNSLKILHDAAATERSQVILRAALCYKNTKMQEIYRLQAAEREHAAGKKSPLTASIGFDENHAYISGINIEDIPVIESITGKPIHRTGPGSYTLKLEHKIFDPFYYMDPRNNVDTDLCTMAAAIKAQGYTSIEHSINIENENIAIERAKQAVLADIEAGFALNDSEIKLVINGRPTKLEELFKDKQAEYQALQHRSNQVQQAINAVKAPAGDPEPVKARLADLVAEGKAKKQQQAAAQTQDDDELQQQHGPGAASN